MQELESFLRKNIGEHRQISLAYSGGSNPGGVREIIITGIHDGDQGLYISGYPPGEVGRPSTKNYRLSRIIWASDELGSKVINNEVEESPNSTKGPVPELPYFYSLEKYAEHFVSGLVGAGWHVTSDPSLLSIGTFFKNGKPKKTPSVAISFDPIPSESAHDHSGVSGASVSSPGEHVRSRPWCVSSWRFKRARTFSDLHHAIQVFAQEAIESDPSTAGLI